APPGLRAARHTRGKCGTARDICRIPRMRPAAGSVNMTCLSSRFLIAAAACTLLTVPTWTGCCPAVAQEPDKPPPEDPAHADLRKLRDDMIDAVNKDDRAKLLSLLHKNIVVTFMDGDTVRGHDGVQKYL